MSLVRVIICSNNREKKRVMFAFDFSCKPNKKGRTERLHTMVCIKTEECSGKMKTISDVGTIYVYTYGPTFDYD